MRKSWKYTKNIYLIIFFEKKDAINEYDEIFETSLDIN